MHLPLLPDLVVSVYMMTCHGGQIVLVLMQSSAIIKLETLHNLATPSEPSRQPDVDDVS